MIAHRALANAVSRRLLRIFQARLDASFCGDVFIVAPFTKCPRPWCNAASNGGVTRLNGFTGGSGIDTALHICNLPGRDSQSRFLLRTFCNSALQPRQLHLNLLTKVERNETFTALFVGSVAHDRRRHDVGPSARGELLAFFESHFQTLQN